MPWSALPEHLNSPEKWKGTDHDQWWGSRWLLYIKGWFAFGPRAKESWARWREWPTTLFACFGEGPTRFETETWERGSERQMVQYTGNLFAYKPPKILRTPWYLSRLQLYTRWHFQIQWPFLIAFHWYFNKNDVLKYTGEKQSVKGKWIYGYFGAHRDTDKYYMVCSAYLGTNSK